jgi:hypothetical protein
MRRPAVPGNRSEDRTCPPHDDNATQLAALASPLLGDSPARAFLTLTANGQDALRAIDADQQVLRASFAAVSTPGCVPSPDGTHRRHKPPETASGRWHTSGR